MGLEQQLLNILGFGTFSSFAAVFYSISLATTYNAFDDFYSGRIGHGLFNLAGTAVIYNLAVIPTLKAWCYVGDIFKLETKNKLENKF